MTAGYPGSLPALSKRGYHVPADGDGQRRRSGGHVNR
jgi:hypothetical protein